jgi:hypothetical protein
MPKLVGVRERRHQPYYDHLIRVDANGTPSPTVQSQTKLFNGTNLGLHYWTNMAVAGHFASDNTYIVLAIRCWLSFTGTSALTMYQLAMQQLYLQLHVGDKPQFLAPAWFFPAGGGIFGFDSSTPSMCNGMPTTEAILKLAKPIPIPARQHFDITADLYDNTTSLRTTYLNATSSIGVREIAVFLDGIHTRDVL